MTLLYGWTQCNRTQYYTKYGKLCLDMVSLDETLVEALGGSVDSQIWVWE